MRADALNRGSARIARALTNRWASAIRVAPPALAALALELDLWAEQGTEARFWWRDDDAKDETLALNRLLALRRKLGLPLAIAAVPADATPLLASRLSAETGVRVLQHGWDHRNHAPLGRPKAEFAGNRERGEVERQLGEGRARLKNLFADLALPVLVPPFNRVAPRLTGIVRALGFRYLSLLGDFQAVGLPSRNVHIDVIAWPQVRAESMESIAQTAIAALRLRRFGLIARAAPIGVMTHHLQQDEETWLSTEALLECLADHRAVAFPGIEAVFAR